MDALISSAVRSSKSSPARNTCMSFRSACLSRQTVATVCACDARYRLMGRGVTPSALQTAGARGIKCAALVRHEGHKLLRRLHVAAGGGVAGVRGTIGRRCAGRHQATVRRASRAAEAGVCECSGSRGGRAERRPLGREPRSSYYLAPSPLTLATGIWHAGCTRAVYAWQSSAATRCTSHYAEPSAVAQATSACAVAAQSGARGSSGTTSSCANAWARTRRAPGQAACLSEQRLPLRDDSRTRAGYRYRYWSRTYLGALIARRAAGSWCR
jgi:hypothetical protein